MRKISLAIALGLTLLAPFAVQGQTITKIEQFLNDGTYITQRIPSTPLKFTGYSNGCVYLVSGVLTINTGNVICSGGGGGGSGSGTVSTTTALVNGQVDFSTSGSTIGNDSNFLWDNTLKQLTATNAIFTSATATQATSTSLFATKSIFTNLSGTNISGFGLASCSGTSALTYSGTTFGCAAQPQGTITALTGDITASGSGSVVATLATVASAGTTGGSTAIPVITINAKGLTTGITTAAVIAPAGTLTGTTLASNVVTSSLTSVGTLTGLTVSGNTSLAAATTSSLGITGLARPAGAILAVDGSGNVIATTTSAGGVTSVSGTSNRITSTGGATPVIDISASYVGQASITTVGTLSSGAVPASLITSGTFGTGNYTFPADLTITGGATTSDLYVSHNASTSALYLATGLCSGTNALNVSGSGKVVCGAVSGSGSASSTLLSDNNTFIGNNVFTNLNWTLATGTQATTTSLFVSGNASTTNLFGTLFNGFGISSCTGASKALTWSGGRFGCNTITSSGGGSGNVATSSAETSGTVPFWTSTSATPATLGSDLKFFYNTLKTAFGVGTSTPQWTAQFASSTAPQLTLSDPTNTTNPHLSERYQSGVLTFSTSSPTTYATSTIPSLSLDTTQASSLKIGSTTPTLNPVNGMIIMGSNGANGTSTISMGKLQFDGYDAGGNRRCLFMASGGSFTSVAGACTP